MLKKITKEIDIVRILSAVNGYVVWVEGRDSEGDYHEERVLCLDHNDIVKLIAEVDSVYANS